MQGTDWANTPADERTLEPASYVAGLGELHRAVRPLIRFPLGCVAFEFAAYDRSGAGMTNEKQTRPNNAPDRGEGEPAPQSLVREGVLAVPGDLKLHFGGQLSSVSVAWRIAGPAGAPVVCALGGISATRRVWQPDEPRAGWWHEVVGPGLSLDTN